MCKLFMLTNGAELTKQQHLIWLINRTLGIITSHDKDGCGYVVAGRSGVYGERYLDIDQVGLSLLKQSLPMPEHLKTMFKTAKGESYGTYSPPHGGVLIHARMSTNKVVLENSHPHWNDHWSLIHNGVVENAGAVYSMKSSCDSEHLLHHLTAGDVEGMVAGVTGYFAVGAIHHATGEMIVVKDSTAGLHGCYVESLHSMAFATYRHHLEEICKSMQWKTSDIFSVEDNVALRFDRDGEFLSKTTISPRKKEYVYNGNYNGGYDDVKGKWDPEFYKNRQWDSESRTWVYTEPKEDSATTHTKKPLVVVPANNGKKMLTDETHSADFWYDDVDRLVRITTKKNRVITYKQFDRMDLKHQAECFIHCRDTGAAIDIFELDDVILDRLAKQA